MKLAVLLVVAAALAAPALAKCPATNGDLHATFTDLSGHISCQMVTGTCQSGYHQNPKGAPSACCSELGNWKSPTNPCIKDTPTPTSTTPTPTSSSTKPAPTSTKPAPSSSQPAPSSSQPAPTSSGKPAPTSSGKPVPSSSSKPGPQPTPKPAPPVPSMAFAVSAVTTYDDQLDSICAGVSFDSLSMTVSNQTVVINSQKQLNGPTVGDCPNWADAPNKQKVPSPTVEPNFLAKVGDMDVEVRMSFLFNVNGTYTADQVFNKTSGDGAVYIRSIKAEVFEINGTDPIASHTWTTKNLQKYLRANHDSSVECKLSTSFTETSDKTNYTLAIENYSIEAMTPRTIHGGPAPVSATSLCPVKSSSASKTGLVIGAIVGALAVLGILLFVYTRCKSERDGYQSLDAV
eukprot:m.27045 g.27045  ORF g.27045 m.27045 type:complete len:403 (+) comp4706_c0_seq1:392-1600(+)